MPRMKAVMLIFTFLLVGGWAAVASAITIDFTNDTAGAKPNGFQSVDSNLVTFTDSVGAGLFISDFGVQSFGKALAVFTDFDNSLLRMDFAVLVNTLSLGFGNDDPSFSNAGDAAELTFFSGVTQVGFVSVVMNRDDIMNQTIAFSGLAFDRAEFFYNVPSTKGMIEIVDNINFTPVPAVPEPSSLLLLGSGLAGLAGWRRRQARLTNTS